MPHAAKPVHVRLLEVVSTADALDSDTQNLSAASNSQAHVSEATPAVAIARSSGRVCAGPPGVAPGGCCSLVPDLLDPAPAGDAEPATNELLFPPAALEDGLKGQPHDHIRCRGRCVSQLLPPLVALGAQFDARITA